MAYKKSQLSAALFKLAFKNSGLFVTLFKLAFKEFWLSAALFKLALDKLFFILSTQIKVAESVQNILVSLMKSTKMGSANLSRQ